MTPRRPVHVIGAGLAGSEATWQLANAGIPVVLHEMRPVAMTPAHKTGGFAELVCSNSFRSDDWETNAVGLLHAEMRRAGSLIMMQGDAHQVPAGGALAVDREGFSEAVTEAVRAHPLVSVEIGEVPALPPPEWGLAVIATGPLTAPSLAAAIAEATGEGQLAFFDAIAPIVHRESIDLGIAWFQSRYDKPGPGGTGADYVNCPLDRAQYDPFVEALLLGEKHAFKEWETSTPYFEGCLPIEVMAERGRDTLRYGPMKPVGLLDPRTGQPANASRSVTVKAKDAFTADAWSKVMFILGPKAGMDIIKNIQSGQKTYRPIELLVKAPYQDKMNLLPVATDEIRRNPALGKGVNVWRGKTVHPAVAHALGERATPLEALLG